MSTKNTNGVIYVYRVEDPAHGCGLWRNFDGSLNDTFTKLTVGKCRNMPMDDSDFYRYDGKQWFASTDSPEKLKAWFDVLDIVQLLDMGFKVYKIGVTNIRTVSEYEVVFTRDAIVEQTVVDPNEIWDDFSAVAGRTPRPDDRLQKIIELTEGTIDHFDRDDAMDLLYQIKEVLK